MLEVVDVHLTYTTASGRPVPALSGLSVTVDAGELVAVFGPSGSGKTTLLQLIARALEPDRGRILVGGSDISELHGRDLYRYRLTTIGWVPQTAELESGVNVVGNAALRLMERGMRRKDAERQVVPLLERLDLGGALERLPAELSEGEKQRVAIASALSTGPRLVLADEPTGRLDPGRARRVRETLAEVCRERGAATLMTTHDPLATAVADRAWTVVGGQLASYAESGQPDPLPSPPTQS